MSKNGYTEINTETKKASAQEESNTIYKNIGSIKYYGTFKIPDSPQKTLTEKVSSAIKSGLNSLGITKKY